MRNKRGKNTRRGAHKKRGFWLGSLIIVLLIGLFVWGWVGTKTSSHLAPSGPSVSSSVVRQETGRPLSPIRFVGKTARAYQVAHEFPDVLDQLYCYCECDKHMGHRTLLSCFVDSHAAT